MILTMNLSGLTNAGLLSFAQSLDVLLAPVSESIIQIYTPFKQALTVCEDTSSEAISKQVAQQQTQELQEADVQRDNLNRGFKFLIQAYQLHPDPEKQEMANELEKSVAKVGWNLHRESYDRQSALMKTLFSELDKKHAERMSLLGIADYYNELKNAQDEFDRIRGDQLNQQAELAQISSMTAVRVDLEKSCKDLLEILPGYYRMTGDKALGAVLPQISELIERTR